MIILFVFFLPHAGVWDSVSDSAAPGFLLQLQPSSQPPDHFLAAGAHAAHWPGEVRRHQSICEMKNQEDEMSISYHLCFVPVEAMSCLVNWSPRSTPVPVPPTHGAIACSPRNSPCKSVEPFFCFNRINLSLICPILTRFIRWFMCSWKVILYHLAVGPIMWSWCGYVKLISVCVCRLRSVSDSSLRKTHADQISVSSSGSSSSDMEDLSNPQPSPLRLKLKVRVYIKVRRSDVDDSLLLSWFAMRTNGLWIQISFHMLVSLSLCRALFRMWLRTSPPCPPPLHDSAAPPAAPHNPTSAPPLWSWTQRHLPLPHRPPAALRRPRCPSTTNRSRTRASSGSAWSASAMETSTRAYWWGPACFATPGFLVSAGFFF